MENRSHALMAGLFTLLLLAAVVGVAIWLGRDRSAVVTYEIVSSTAVSGLSAQSAVRYQGVPVGRVQSLSLNPDRPGQVRIRIGVAPATPITESTWAELGVQGFTGFANIELRDDGSSASRLATTPEHPAAIPLRAGLFDRIEQRGTAVLGNIDQATQQLTRLLSNENVQALTAVLQNAADVSAQLREAGRNLVPLARRLDETLARMGEAARETSGLAHDARAALARLESPEGPLAAASQSLRQITSAAARLDQETLPALKGMATGVNAAARNASSTLRRVGDTPQSLLFGPPPAMPGPGENGFAGFGREPQ